MEVSFANPTSENKPQPVPASEPAPTQAPATQPEQGCPTGPQGPEGPAGNPNPTTAVATVSKNVALGSPLPMGDTIPEFEDIIFPRLNIVQKVGDLSNVFTHGAIVFDQTVVIYEPPTLKDGAVIKPGTEPLDITVLGFKTKRFVERVDGGKKGQICKTEADVVKAGGTLNYQEHELKKGSGLRLFQTLSEALVVVFKPAWVKDEGNAVFTYDVDGRPCALALWGMKGTAYTHGAKAFFTARGIGCLRKEGYPSWSWNLTTKLATTKGNSYFIPVLVPRTHSTSAMFAFAQQVISGS